MPPQAMRGGGCLLCFHYVSMSVWLLQANMDMSVERASPLHTRNNGGII